MTRSCPVCRPTGSAFGESFPCFEFAPRQQCNTNGHGSTRPASALADHPLSVIREENHAPILNRLSHSEIACIHRYIGTYLCMKNYCRYQMTFPNERGRRIIPGTADRLGSCIRVLCRSGVVKTEGRIGQVFHEYLGGVVRARRGGYAKGGQGK